MEKELNVDVKSLWQRLIDLIIKTIISGEHTINQLSSANLGSRYNSYELFGIDVLFDTELKPWLLEVRFSLLVSFFFSFFNAFDECLLNLFIVGQHFSIASFGFTVRLSC